MHLTSKVAVLVTVYYNGEVSESMNIKQGIRQGCVASPHMFALYTEMIMRDIEGK